jgi:hypothetical protein
MNPKTKKILIALVGFVVVVALALYSMLLYTSSFSPEATATLSHNGLDLKVVYCQPAKKGRAIFGGLLPYGQVWRTGANAATIFETNRDIKVAGQVLNAGKYSLWSIPGQTEWTIIFNRETGQWGTQYNASADVLRVKVPAGALAAPQEMFNIGLAGAGTGVEMTLAWDVVQVKVPIE